MPNTNDASRLRVGYLVNQYPKISHTFIRTEIEGHERLGTTVHRFSVRPSPDALLDADDLAEQGKTRILLHDRWGLLTSVVAALMHPAAFSRSLALAVRVGFGSDRGLLRHFMYFAEACLLKRWTASADVQHLHVHFGTNSAAVAMLCGELGGPGYSFTAHGPEEFDKPDLIGLATKIRNARFVVGVSHFGRAQLWRHTDASQWDKIHIVRCGVDRRFLEPAPDALPDVPRLVSVGRLSEQKGQLVLVRAAAALKARLSHFEIVLIGDGELRSLLEASIEDLGLSAHVRITGWQSPDEVCRHILDSRAMVLPSFAEGLPVVIMEALALRRPVISTYVAGIPELVIPDETGWLVPAGSTDHLVAAMEEALTAPVQRLAAMGDAGHERVSLQHDARKNAAQLNRLIADVVAHARR